MEKGTRVEQIAAAARRLHDAGIEVGFFLQFGYPGETLEDIELTLQMVRDCRPDDIGVSVSYPLPGTPFHERVKAQLGEKQNWVDSNDLAMMYRADLRAGVLPRAACARARRVPGAEAPRRRRSPREAAAGASTTACERRGSSRRCRRLARDTSAPALIIRPVLSQQAAAIPTDQP